MDPVQVREIIRCIKVLLRCSENESITRTDIINKTALKTETLNEVLTYLKECGLLFETIEDGGTREAQIHGSTRVFKNKNTTKYEITNKEKLQFKATELEKRLIEYKLASISGGEAPSNEQLHESDEPEEQIEAPVPQVTRIVPKQNCLWCGKPLVYVRGVGRPKLYCDKKCQEAVGEGAQCVVRMLERAEGPWKLPVAKLYVAADLTSRGTLVYLHDRDMSRIVFRYGVKVYDMEVQMARNFIANDVTPQIPLAIVHHSGYILYQNVPFDIEKGD
jgi:hypothetical protein